MRYLKPEIETLELLRDIILCQSDSDMTGTTVWFSEDEGDIYDFNME